MAVNQIDWRVLKLKTERKLLGDCCIREVVEGLNQAHVWSREVEERMAFETHLRDSICVDVHSVRQERGVGQLWELGHV